MTSSGSSSSGDDPDTAAAAAAGSSRKPSKQQQLFDALDGASLALTTASLGLSAALCALCLNHTSLAWAGVLLLGFIVAAPVVVGALILARNHWLVVALRYCLSVAALQRDSGLGFTSVRSRVLRLVLSGLSSCLLSMVGLVVALYLTACYVVTAVLSVPLLDCALLVSLLPWPRRRFIAQDLVFLESYKPARALVVARVGVLRQLGLTLRLKGGLRLPDYVADEALAQMVKDGGRRLHLSNVWYWGSSSSSAGGKLPLVPRYLFPPDGGWLVPGQMCHLAAQAYSSLADSSSSSGNSGNSSTVQVLEIEHAASQDLSVLLRGGLESLPQLRSVSLNWCCLGINCLPPQLLLASKCLQTLTLSRCEVSGYGASLLKELLASRSCPLVSLSIVKCQMSSTSVRAIAAGVAVNSSLRSVKFSGNLGGKPAALAFATALQANPGSLQHLNLSFNKLCPSGGDALANAIASAHARAAAAAGSSSSSSSSSGSGLQRLIVQRKEVGGAGLRALVQGLRRCTGYSGKLSLRVLQQPNPGAAQGEGSGPGVLEPTADCITAQSVAAAAAAVGSSSSSSSSSSKVEQLRGGPMLIFLSQNDPCDSVAAALKNVEGLVTADLAGLPLGNKGVKAEEQ
ncbi:hypothetical protein OEZ85_009977 [Tetradesmus obliquus]|uniref:Uncharacterized protein n=1 Tax=Tetradesmus obliquus TaxID=3088 RepID=A0ABY8UDT9_TETOB|nr:hypothetical protein OEZ85_009977 [Tetradesmus obliquus]